jgi:predicted Zn finger-like uncharacterized protein
MRLQCPKCEANIHVPSVPEDGARVKCPKCQARFLPPDGEDEDDDSPRTSSRGKKKKGKKKEQKKFPVVPVAIASVGAVVLTIAAVVILVGGSKKKKDDAAANSSSGPTANAPNAPAPPSTAGERPKELPKEVAELFAKKDDPAAYPPPSSFNASLVVPKTGSNELTVTLPVGAAAPKSGGKMTGAEVEKASVYIKVRDGQQGGSGSGFLIRANQKEGLIATNFHVIEFAVLSEHAPRAKVTVVFDSGLKTEIEYTAEIVAAEPEVDLAILRIVNAANLPKPLEPKYAVPPSAPLDILIYGFPLGELLATGGHSPAITIGKGAISSLRRGANREIERLQIDGNVNPGNSGGPVVDTDGRLVGITVAKLKEEFGSGIGFAIPAAELVAALEGRVVYPGFLPPIIRNSEAVFHAMIPVSDPLKQMKSVSLLSWAGTGSPPAASKTPGGGWKPIAGATTVPVSAPLKGLAGADVHFPAQQGDRNVVFQMAVTTTSGRTICSAPVTYQLRVETRLNNSDMPASIFAQSAQRFENRVVPIRAVMTGPPSTVWDKHALTLVDEIGRPLPGWLFLVDKEFATLLKEVAVPAGKGLPVRLAIRVGKSRADIGPALRVVRADFMDGARITKTIPPVEGPAESDQNALAALNQSPNSFVGRDVAVDGRMSMSIRGTPQEPQFTLFLPDGKPAAGVYFTSSKQFADKVRAVDLPLGSVDHVRATVRVEDKKINNLPAATIVKLEFLGRNGDIVKTID